VWFHGLRGCFSRFTGILEIRALKASPELFLVITPKALLAVIKLSSLLLHHISLLSSPLNYPKNHTKIHIHHLRHCLAIQSPKNPMKFSLSTSSKNTKICLNLKKKRGEARHNEEAKCVLYVCRLAALSTSTRTDKALLALL
jgi:hypothetical protein